MSKKIIGDYGTNNTFTVYESTDNSGNQTFRIGTTDDDTSLLGYLLLPLLPIWIIYKIVKFFKEAIEEERYEEEHRNSKYF